MAPEKIAINIINHSAGRCSSGRPHKSGGTHILEKNRLVA
jgi:hypothetical protein